jgi:hypothetical protein
MAAAAAGRPPSRRHPGTVVVAALCPLTTTTTTGLSGVVSTWLFLLGVLIGFKKTNKRVGLKTKKMASVSWVWESGLGNPANSMLLGTAPATAMKFACKICDVTHFMLLDDLVMREHCRTAAHTFGMHADGKKTTLDFWEEQGNSPDFVVFAEDGASFLCRLCDTGAWHPNNLRVMGEHIRSEPHMIAKAVHYIDTVPRAQKQQRLDNAHNELRSFWEDALGNPKDSMRWLTATYYSCGVCGPSGHPKSGTQEGMANHCRTVMHQRKLRELRQQQQESSSPQKRQREEEEEEEDAILPQPMQKRPPPPPPQAEAVAATVAGDDQAVVSSPPPPPQAVAVAATVADNVQPLVSSPPPPPEAEAVAEAVEAIVADDDDNLCATENDEDDEAQRILPQPADAAQQQPVATHRRGLAYEMFLQASGRFLEQMRPQIVQKKNCPKLNFEKIQKG